MTSQISILLLERYKSVRLELLCTEIYSRVVWILLLLSPLIFNVTEYQSLGLLLIAVVHFLTMAIKIKDLTVLINRISISLGKVNPKLEDDFIIINREIEYTSYSPLRRIMKYEQLIWVVGFTYSFALHYFVSFSS